MGSPFEAEYALHHAGVVFPRRFLVRTVPCQVVKLLRLGGGARVEFVRNRDGHQRHPTQPVAKGRALAAPRQHEHLEQRWFRAVETILGAPIALGDPNRVAGPQGGADVAGSLRQRRILRPSARRLTSHHEALVEAHEVLRGARREQVVPHGNLGSAMPRRPQRIVHQARVERDVAVVGDEKMRSRRVQPV